MIRPNRAHTRVFPDQNYRAWTAVGAQNSLGPWSDLGFFSQQLGFVFISIILRIGFSLDDFNTANTSFYEMNIL